MTALIEGLYGGHPTKSARNQVQRGVGELRKHGVSIIERDGSYMIDTSLDAVDAWEFKKLTEQASAAVPPADKATLLWRALRVWRGPALGDLDSDVFRAAAIEWEERRLTALEARVDAELALGGHGEIIPELQRLVIDHPLRESSHERLMLAYYRAGRPGEALTAYAELRTNLAEELGIDPSADVQRLYERILRQEPVPIPQGSVPRQLPRRPWRVIGRHGELTRIRGALETGSRVVAVVGAAGSGKTTLALEAAHEVASMFPDGHLYITKPDNALPAILRALDGGYVPNRGEEGSARMQTLLAGRRVMIVLEDVTSAAQIRPVLPASSECALIVTSSCSLMPLRDAVQVTLAELPFSDAWTLLAESVGARRLEAEPDATRYVLEVCGGLPLALDIVAAKLAAKPHWSIGRLAARLRDHDALLDELRHDDLHLRVALDRGYRTLSPDLRVLLRVIGHHGSTEISAREVSRIAGLALTETERRLEALAEAKLLHVRAGEGGGLRYHCTAMILAHAREKALAESPAAELVASLPRLRHARPDGAPCPS
ncbi:BTAD domain-containing putative transcriptional regulator [Microbispora sp. ZYX-F-249]|uniref:BTAD domain-containing putative transcriptional regulator n=1 Tax=Microbispora maris TaxID=3144104 RepID=A0ABV0AJ19_9ACTN